MHPPRHHLDLACCCSARGAAATRRAADPQAGRCSRGASAVCRKQAAGLQGAADSEDNRVARGAECWRARGPQEAVQVDVMMICEVGGQLREALGLL